MRKSALWASFLAFVLVLGGAQGARLPAAAPLTVLIDPDEALEAAQKGRLNLALPTGPLSLVLEPRRMDGVVWGVNGQVQGSVNEVRTFTGTANGNPARLTVTPAGIFLAVFSPDTLFVQPMAIREPGAPALHSIIQWSDAPPYLPEHQEIAPPTPTRNGPTSDAACAAPLPGRPASACRVANVLLESDFQFWKTWTGNGACPNCWIWVQQALINFIEGQWEPQIGLKFQITSQWVCPSPAACNYANLAPDWSDWWWAFRDKWEANADEPAHDVGMLFIGTNLPLFSGTAPVPGAATSNGYAVVEWLPIVPAISTGITQYATAAHEVGHLFNGVHEEADNIAGGQVWTIMSPVGQVYFSFSSGTLNPGHNNAARIVSYAVANLPP